MDGYLVPIETLTTAPTPLATPGLTFFVQLFVNITHFPSEFANFYSGSIKKQISARKYV